MNPKNYNFNFKTLIKKTIFENFITNFTLCLLLDTRQSTQKLVTCNLL